MRRDKKIKNILKVILICIIFNNFIFTCEFYFVLLFFNIILSIVFNIQLEKIKKLNKYYEEPISNIKFYDYRSEYKFGHLCGDLCFVGILVLFVDAHLSILNSVILYSTFKKIKYFSLMIEEISK